MKKFLSLLLALTLAVSLCACGGNKQQDVVVGDWQANFATVSGIEGEFTDASLAINEDGTGTFVFMKDTADLTWKYDDGGELTTKEDGASTGVRFYAVESKTLSGKFVIDSEGKEDLLFVSENGGFSIRFGRTQK